MHTTVRSLVAAVLISSPLLAAAVDEHHPDQAPAKAESSSAKAQDQAMTEQMKEMQAIHDRIAAAKTPEERQAAMHDGMLAMSVSSASVVFNALRLRKVSLDGAVQNA